MAATVREVEVFPICIREVEVLRVEDVTPGMRRVIVGGSAMDSHVRDGVRLPAVCTNGFDDDVKLLPVDPQTGALPFDVPRNTDTGAVDWPAGSFQYTALGVKDAGTTVGTSPLSQTAQGTFIQVDLKIANTGNSSATFLVNYVKLVDASGKTYDADPTATLYANPDQNAWVAAINPGNAIQGPVLFDVPAGTHATSIRVSDTVFSAGKTIRLG